MRPVAGHVRLALEVLVHLILILAVAGGTAWACSQALNASGMTQKDLTPRVGGYNANMLTAGLGLIGLLVGGPLLAAAGAGAIAGSLINVATTPRIEAGFQNVVALTAAGAATDPGGPSQLPATTPSTTPTPPIRDPSQRWPSWLSFNPFRRQAA